MCEEVLNEAVVKMIIITLLTTAVSVLVGMLGDWNPYQNAFLGKVVALAVIVVLYLVDLIWYATVEVNRRQTVEVLEQQVEAFTNLVINIISTCEMNAADINQCIHHVNETQKIDPNIWNFKKSCKMLCRQIYSRICQLGKSKNYAVAYVALDEGAANKDTVMLIAYANQNMHSPSIYDKPRHFADAYNTVDAYHDLKLFSKAEKGISGATSNDVLLGVDEVTLAFRYPTQEAMTKNQGKYHAYVGIPVFCDNRRW